MMTYSNPNGESLEMALPLRPQNRWWLGNHPVHDRPAGM
jgi:hypothetical protein